MVRRDLRPQQRDGYRSEQEKIMRKKKFKLLQEEAKERGHMYFYTGKPCIRNHDSPRLTSCYNCAQCQEEWQARRRAASKERKAEIKKNKIVKPTKRGTTPRALAKKAGENTYMTGKPCIHGHISPRFTKNASCIKCYDIATNYARKIVVYKEARITEEEIKAESFKDMIKRVYTRDQTW